MKLLYTILVYLAAAADARGGDAPGRAAISPQKPAAPSLCAALEAIQPGDQLPVALTGFYREKDGEKLLYEGRSCRSGAESAALVDFAAHAKFPSDLRKFLKGSDATAWVSFNGTLEHRSHGSGEGRRIRLVVETISDVWFPAAEWWPKAPSPWQGDRSPYPAVHRFAAISRYPPEAARLGVEGKVVVEITLKRGNEMTTDIISTADRLLVEATLANIKTWLFDPAAEAKFRTTFTYRLERDLPPTTASVRVETELPGRVEVIAPPG